MIRDIVIFGDPVLRQKCALVGEVTDEIRTLAEDMLETMVAADGVGLAAPQVAEPIQLAIVDLTHAPDSFEEFLVDGEEAALDEWMPLIFTNPKIKGSKERESDREGCLSFPDLRADIRRPASITAELTLLDGRTVTVEADGLLARAIQHETDHLNGILFIDRLPSASKLGLKRKIQRIQNEYGLRLKLEKPEEPVE